MSTIDSIKFNITDTIRKYCRENFWYFISKIVLIILFYNKDKRYNLVQKYESINLSSFFYIIAVRIEAFILSLD